VKTDGLEQIRLFAALGEEERSTLAELAEDVAVPAGERLILEGDFGYQFFAIKEGLAEVTHAGERIGDLRPGDVFGEIALLVTGRRTATVTALTPMQLIVLFDRNFRQVERLVPEFGRLLRAESWSRLRPPEPA
jgi:CRP-like cAMP-binding protein